MPYAQGLSKKTRGPTGRRSTDNERFHGREPALINCAGPGVGKCDDAGESCGIYPAVAVARLADVRTVQCQMGDGANPVSYHCRCGDIAVTPAGAERRLVRRADVGVHRVVALRLTLSRLSKLFDPVLFAQGVRRVHDAVRLFWRVSRFTYPVSCGAGLAFHLFGSAVLILLRICRPGVRR